MNAAEFDSPNDDCQWQAFRYVLGEMSAAEADAFEEILAADQKARELVARSTGVLTDLLAAERLPVPACRTVVLARPASLARPGILRRAERFRGWTITAVAAVVCCCVAIGVCLIPLGGPGGLNDIYSGDLSDSGAGHLVAIWSQRLAELAPEIATTETAATEPTVSERTEAPLPGDVDDSRLATATETAPADSAAVGDQVAADDSVVPGWMIAAVELGQVQKPAGSPSSEIWEN